jgi:hypothetical protein
VGKVLKGCCAGEKLKYALEYDMIACIKVMFKRASEMISIRVYLRKNHEP